MSEKSAEQMEALLGGAERTVTHRDGRTEVVKVRHLTIVDLNRYAAAIDAESKLAQLYTGKDAAWVEGLSDASLVLVVTEGDRLNSFLADLLALRLQRQARLAPNEFARLMQAALPNGVPASPPKAG